MSALDEIQQRILAEQLTIDFRDMLSGISAQATRPSVLHRPTLRFNLRKWIAEYPSDFPGVPGILGVGDSAEEAMLDFDRKWKEGEP